MFNLSGSEIVIILLLALVILGPDKLPDAMRKAGRTWAELRKLSSGFQEEVRKGFEEPATELRQTASAVKKATTMTTNPVKGTVKSLLDPPSTSTTTAKASAAAAAASVPEPVAGPVAEPDQAADDAEIVASEIVASEIVVADIVVAEVAKTDVDVTESGESTS